jgi:hypothetical protein
MVIYVDFSWDIHGGIMGLNEKWSFSGILIGTIDSFHG